jgi:hypothetical protein
MLRGPAMDVRRSFYLGSRPRNFDGPALDDDERGIHSDIPYIPPANDNSPVKDKLSARCGTFLRRLIALNSLT